MIADLVKSVFQWCVVLGTRVLLSLFTDFSIQGREHLENLPTPLLIVGNHRSFWDIPLIGVLMPYFSRRYYPIGLMARDSYFRNPVVRLIMWLGGGVRAHKGEGIDISLREPRLILAKKKVFVIFPFGKMVWDGNYPQPGRGTAALIQEVPDLFVLPVYMDTTPNLTLSTFIFGRPRMQMRLGALFQVSGAKERTLEEITDIVLKNLFALGKY